VTSTRAVDGGLVARTVASSGARLDLPPGWTVAVGPPTIAAPPAWDGGPPAVVVTVEHDDLSGERLATAVASAAATRLTDAVVVSLALVDRARAGPDDVEIVVAHRHRGVDVTTVERHHCRTGPARWVVGFTMAHAQVPQLLPLARRVVASLVTDV
jgi:hypothetical protein